MLGLGFYSEDELAQLGLGSYGKNVLISKRCSLYGLSRIHIGNNVRIDDFCVLSAGEGGIYLGDFIHIGIYTSLIGGGKINIQSFCNISSKVAIYSSNDDYSGLSMTSPIVPREFTNITHGDVTLKKHVIVGCNSTILPNVVLEQGACVGAYSLIKNNCEEFGVYVGTPAIKIKSRSRKLLDLEKSFLKLES